MKVKIRRYNDEILGIDLISENKVEQDIVQRFWEGGIKINAIMNSSDLGLTFKDLVDK